MGKIGILIPWYGETMPEGTELELRKLAAHLQDRGIEVEVLTTCVRDASADWNKNYYAVGESFVENVPVRRFPVTKRNQIDYQRIEQKMRQNIPLTIQDERTFLEESLNSQELLDYLQETNDRYDLYLFISYSFGLTYYGMQLFPEKSILFPNFRQGSKMQMRLFRQGYIHAAGMLYTSPTEQELAGKNYDFTSTRQMLVGLGMETDLKPSKTAFREKYGVVGDFILYAGKRNTEKNPSMLIQYFHEYCTRNPESDLQLVLLGKGEVQIPEAIRERVIDLGYIPDEDKYNAMAASVLHCHPSTQETFCRSMMEGWLCGTPTLVNGHCAVTKSFVRLAEGGLYYNNYFEFEGCVKYFLQNPTVADQMGENGKEYVKNNFDWEVVLQKYETIFQQIREENR